MTVDEPTTTSNDAPEATPGGGPALPPYEGRKKSADVAPADQGEAAGVGVGGARRPTEADDQLRQTDPRQSDRGPVASPADEQPAADEDRDRSDEGSTGPAHQPGVPRGEDLQ